MNHCVSLVLCAVFYLFLDFFLNCYSRYHNGTLLDKKVYKYEEDLVLRDLKPEQSGQYYCKTSSPAGSIKSSPAFLTVIGTYSFLFNSSVCSHGQNIKL